MGKLSVHESLSLFWSRITLEIVRGIHAFERPKFEFEPVQHEEKYMETKPIKIKVCDVDDIKTASVENLNRLLNEIGRNGEHEFSNEARLRIESELKRRAENDKK